jgi:hypothetical protein
METSSNLLLESPKPFVLYLIALGGCDKYISSVRVRHEILDYDTPARNSCPSRREE